MKLLLAGLIIAALFGTARAASTDTVTASTDTLEGTMKSIANDMSNFAVDLANVLPVEIPVEQKVVEIHMFAAEVEEQSAKTKRRSRGLELPLLRVRRGTCSGALINDQGDILTAKHCVDEFTEFEVQTADRRSYAAVVVATSAAHDLAIIHIDRRNTPSFTLADSVTRGQTVFVLGSPLGITDTLSTGVIARIDGDVTLLDCSALPGNSGGPVFDSNNNLVGILTAVHIVGLGVTHLSRAQGLDAVHFFLKEALEKRYGSR